MLEILLALYNPNMNPACLIPLKIVGVSETPELSFFLLTFSLPFSLVVSWLHVPAASISGCHFLPSCIFFYLLRSLTLQKTSSKSSRDTCSHWEFQQYLPFMWCPVSLKHHRCPKHHYVHFIFFVQFWSTVWIPLYLGMGSQTAVTRWARRMPTLKINDL